MLYLFQISIQPIPDIRGVSMNIDIFSKNQKLKRLTLEYCQHWNCYPVIKLYSKKDELLKEVSSQEVNVIILADNKENNQKLRNEIQNIKSDIKVFQIIQEEIAGENNERSNTSKDDESILVKEIAKILTICNIPSSNTALCRVHFKPS